MARYRGAPGISGIATDTRNTVTGVLNIIAITSAYKVSATQAVKLLA